VREQAWLAVVQERRQIDATIPIGGQIGDPAVRQSGLQPSQHKFAWRELTASDLVAYDQGPDQTQDQLYVPIDNVHIANVHQLDVIRLNGL